MATATLDFTGDSKQAQKAVDELTKKVAKLTETNRVMREQSAKGTNDAVGGWKRELGAISQAAAGYIGVGAAIGVVASAHRNLQAELKRSGEAHVKFIKDQLAGAVQSGNLLNLPKIEAFTKGGGGTQEQL